MVPRPKVRSRVAQPCGRRMGVAVESLEIRVYLQVEQKTTRHRLDLLKRLEPAKTISQRYGKCVEECGGGVGNGGERSQIPLG